MVSGSFRGASKPILRVLVDSPALDKPLLYARVVEPFDCRHALSEVVRDLLDWAPILSSPLPPHFERVQGVESVVARLDSGGGILTRDLRVMRWIDGGPLRHIWLCEARSGRAVLATSPQIGTKLVRNRIREEWLGSVCHEPLTCVSPGFRVAVDQPRVCGSPA